MRGHNPTSNRQRLGVHAYFDLLRSGAAQLVLVGHAVTIGMLSRTQGTNWYYVQAFGVVLLIMISGYLIAGSVRRRVNDGSFSFWTFMRDRGARIFTPLLPLIPVVIVLDKLLLPGTGTAWTKADHSLQTVLYQAFLLNDNHLLYAFDVMFKTRLFTRAVGSAAPLWAVALEWWLYVAFAAIIALTIRWKQTRLRYIVLAMAIFATGSVITSMTDGNWRPLGWVVTAAAGWFAVSLNRIPAWAWRLLAALGLALVVVTMTAYGRGVYMAPTAIGAGTMIVAIAKGFPLAWLSFASAPAAFFAKYSYSLFLVHYPVLVYLQYNRVTGVMFVLLAMVISHAVALMWWWLFESRSPAVRDALTRAWPHLIQAYENLRPTRQASSSPSTGEKQPENSGVGTVRVASVSTNPDNSTLYRNS